MAREIPKKTAVIILVLAAILSVAGTWLILSSGPMIVGAFLK